MHKARIYAVEHEGKVLYVGCTNQISIMQRIVSHSSVESEVQIYGVKDAY